MNPGAFEHAAEADRLRTKVRRLLWGNAQYVADVLAAATERDLDDPRAVILRREAIAAEKRLVGFLEAHGVVL